MNTWQDDKEQEAYLKKWQEKREESKRLFLKKLKGAVKWILDSFKE